MVAHACNSSTLEGQGRLIAWCLRPAWPTWRNPVSTKINKNWPGVVMHACNPSYSGGWGRRITWTQEAEVTVSQDCATALQPGQQEWNCVSKIRKNAKDQLWISLVPDCIKVICLYYLLKVKVYSLLRMRTWFRVSKLFLQFSHNVKP